VFNFFKRGIETGCTGCAYQMPENTHRNRMIHFYILIVFIGRWLPADLMSVKIRRFEPSEGCRNLVLNGNQRVNRVSRLTISGLFENE
jgi:hypothetical protein